MKGLFQKLYYRWWKKPETLVEALKQRVSPRVIDELLIAHEPTELISVLSESRGFDKVKLLSHVGSVFGCMPMAELRVPTEEDIRLTGYDKETLEGVPAVPLAIAAGYMLVVADPLSVDRKAYTDIGVPVGLSTVADITRCWSKFGLKAQRVEAEYPFNTAQSLLLELASDARVLGAIEVVIGAHAPSEYQLEVGAKSYRGILPEDLYLKLCREIEHSGERSWQEPHTEIQSLSIVRNDSELNPLFYLSWKQRKVAPMKFYPDPAQEHVAQVKNRRRMPNADVLLLDDSVEFSAVAVSLLRDKGYRVIKESNPHRALEELCSGRSRPRVVVSDVHMPQMNGAEFLQILRRENLSVPVIMLTSDETPEVEVELAALGCDAFIQKQQKPEVLLAWVKNLLERGGRARKKGTKAVKKKQSQQSANEKPRAQQSSAV